MPFVSEKQKKLLRWKHPKIYRSWSKKYGTKIKRRGGLKRRGTIATRKDI